MIRSTRPRRTAAIAVTTFVLGGMAAAPAAARSIVELRDGLARIEGETQVLRLAQAQASPDRQIANVSARLGELEEEIRRMRGTIDELEYRQRRIEARIDELQLSPAQAAPGPDQASPREGADAGTTSAAVAPSPAEGATASEPTGLGSAATGAAGSAPILTAALDESAPARDRYESSLQLLQRGDWDGAQEAFEAFLRDHPDDALAGNAAYWLGETFYIRKNFAEAAAVFARNYRSYGADSGKAPDNLLKLGMSLAALGDRDRACQTFTELAQRHENASAPIKQTLSRERAAAGCS
jgi:tol-pal system protein YbgF